MAISDPKFTCEVREDNFYLLHPINNIVTLHILRVHYPTYHCVLQQYIFTYLHFTYLHISHIHIYLNSQFNEPHRFHNS